MQFQLNSIKLEDAPQVSVEQLDNDDTYDITNVLESNYSVESITNDTQEHQRQDRPVPFQFVKQIENTTTVWYFYPFAACLTNENVREFLHYLAMVKPEDTVYLVLGDRFSCGGYLDAISVYNALINTCAKVIVQISHISCLDVLLLMTSADELEISPYNYIEISPIMIGGFGNVIDVRLGTKWEEQLKNNILAHLVTCGILTNDEFELIKDQKCVYLEGDTLVARLATYKKIQFKMTQ